MFSVVQTVDTSPVKVSTVQNAVMSSAAKAAMYTSTSQPAGAVSRAASLSRGERCSNAEKALVFARGTAPASPGAPGGSCCV
ncbi:hypothetical protein SRABI128_05096 [Microbacterium sp. Bi128]|nr:hypothetical protein SRABI128_05096 [Microbacterium sp. Bi128]